MDTARLNRRKLLLGAGALAAGAYGIASARPSSAQSAPGRPTPEAVIIGAGYAGAIAALRLSEAGIRSVLLERGRRWPIQPDGKTFATLDNPDRRASWMGTTLPTEKYVGVLESVRADGVTAVVGAGVGGGSLVNHGVTMQPPEQFFRRSFGGSLDYGEMARVWYPSARRLLGATPVPDDILADRHYSSAREFLREARAAGFGILKPDILVDWDVVRQEIAGRRVPSAIAGESELGMNSGAKLSVDRTILARAEATGRVEVRILHQVVDVRPLPDGRYEVHCERIDEFGNVLDRPVIVARYVFFAAGSIGTSRLLVRAKAIGSLPALSDRIGEQWGCNGDRLVIRVGMPGPPSTGGPGHIAATDWRDPGSPVTLAEFPGGPSPSPGEGASGTFTMQIAPAIGGFRYDSASDSVKAGWPANDPRAIRLDTTLAATIDRMTAANPGTRVFSVNKGFTSHPLGGAVLGAATRTDGSLHGYRNLFVIDSALIPGSTGAVTPSLTVAALAERCVTLAIAGIRRAAA